MDERQRRYLLQHDPDYILLKRFDYSLTLALKRYPDGLRDDLVAQALGISETALAKRYQEVVVKLQEAVGA